MRVRYTNTVGRQYVPDCLKDFEDMFESMEIEIKSLYNEIEALQKENARLQSENYKDEELAKMQERLSAAQHALRLSFPVLEEDDKAINEWMFNHERKCHTKDGGGGRYSYIFDPTPIGMFGSVCCEVCRQKAIQESKGDTQKYYNLMHKLDAEFIFQKP